MDEWVHVMVVHGEFLRKKEGKRTVYVRPRSIVDDRGKKGGDALTLSAMCMCGAECEWMWMPLDRTKEEGGAIKCKHTSSLLCHAKLVHFLCTFPTPPSAFRRGS